MWLSATILDSTLLEGFRDLYIEDFSCLDGWNPGLLTPNSLLYDIIVSVYNNQFR